MSAWPQQNNGIFPGMLDASNQQNVFDPNMFGGGTINPAQFSNPQMQQHMASNSGMLSQNAFPGQNFNVGQVVPSKRSSDGIIMSPGPQQNANSRSETPMQPGTPFQGGQGQQFSNPYQHLQQGTSADASPSPTIPNQQFRPPQPPQRMTTQSPAGFNQMSNAPGGQMSPTSSTPQQQGQQIHGMSMSPQPQQQNFSPGLGVGQGFNQQFVNPQGMMQQGGPGSMNNMNVPNTNMTAMMQAQLQQRQYQQRMLQQQQRTQANAMLGGRPGQMGGNPMQNQMGGQMNQQFAGGMQQQQLGQGMQNGQMQQQMQAHPQQQQQQGQQKPAQPGNPQASTAEKARTWLANLQQFQQAAGKPFNPSPTISGRPVNLYMLWACVAGQFQGSSRTTAMNAWGAVASKLGFQNSPTAAQELKNAFETYIGGWEKQMMAVRQAQRNAGAAQSQMNARQMANAQGSQGSPSRPMQEAQSGFQNPMQQFQQAPPQAQAQIGMPDMNQNQLQRPGSQMQNGMNMSGTPALQDRQASLPRQESVPPQSRVSASPATSLKPDLKTPVMKREPSPEAEKTEFTPSKRNLEVTHGGYPIEPLYSVTKEAALVSQESIRAQTMFMSDMRSLTLSLQSGIASEVRYAIDSIIDLSSKTIYYREGHSRHANPGVIILDKCDDLLDSILDCVEDHLELLSKSPTSSDTIHMPTYEELLHMARSEQDYLCEMIEPGTDDYRLLNAADRLVALLGILSNVSMDHFNLAALASSDLLGPICRAIRHIGTRKLFLRSHSNTLDFYKFVIGILSNLATARLEISTRDDAMAVLQFILAFGPQPPASLKPGEQTRFSVYNPAVHRYLPAAVDTLAKILARQEPNRSVLRGIFAGPQAATDGVAPIDLLTRAFEMCVAFLPDRTKGPLLFDAEINLLKLRKAYLAQGMLAADVLASLIPSHPASDTSSVNIARAWLEADSKWPASLVRVAFLLSTSPKANENLLAPQDRPYRRDPHGQIVRDRATGQILYEETNDVPGMTANRALRMLLRLVETAMADSLPTKRGKAIKKVKDAQVTNGAAESEVEIEDAPMQTNGNHQDDDGGNESESELDTMQILIAGDPIPKRETITALLGTPQAVDAEAVRTMDRLYNLIMPRA